MSTTDGRLLGEVVVIDDIGPGRRSRAYPSGGFAALLLAPVVLLLGAVLLWPVARTVQASLTGPAHRYAGLAHFRIQSIPAARYLCHAELERLANIIRKAKPVAWADRGSIFVEQQCRANVHAPRGPDHAQKVAWLP